MEGYNHLENSHPEVVVNQVNKIAAYLDSIGEFRFSIKQVGLSSIIEIESGELTTTILNDINQLALADNKTTIDVMNRNDSIKTITVNINPNLLN